MIITVLSDSQQQFVYCDNGTFCGRTAAMTQIMRAAEKLVKRHKGLREAAKVACIDAAYLCRLRSGKKANPSDAILRKLGIERRVSYRRAVP
jgi:hypothetical protein